jgi:tetratricopeptide (TPR) repeat protein
VDFNAAIKFLPPQAYRFYVRGWVHLRLHNYDEALADFHQALQLDPNHAFTCNELAWYYVTGSKDRRAPDQALLLAQKAVRLDRKNWYYRNTLGVVFYRLGQWDAAIETLERAVQDHENEATAHDLYFLAMSYHHLRDTGKAKESLDKAVHWHQEHPRNTSYEKEELKAIRDEAEALLGKPGSP